MEQFSAGGLAAALVAGGFSTAGAGVGTGACWTAVGAAGAAGAWTVAFGAVGAVVRGLTFVVGATAFGVLRGVVLALADGVAEPVAAGADVAAGGRPVVRAGCFGSCSEEIHAVIPAIRTTTTMLIPTSGARVLA